MIVELPAANLALIGFMAAGKTSVGRALSVRTGLPFLDVDELVEAAEGITVPEIFGSRGEAYFRVREGLCFRNLCAGAGQIIGCGGGTLIDSENRTALRTRCFAIWLRTSEQEIVRRIRRPDAPERPLVEGVDPEVVVPPLLRSREPLYQSAELIVDTDGRTVAEIVEEICGSLGWMAEDRP